MVVDTTTRKVSARPRIGLVDRHESSIKPSSNATNPSSSAAGGVAALRKRSALVDMTSNGSRRLNGGSIATSEGIQSSGKEISSGAVSRGKLAVRDSNISTLGGGAAAARNAKAGIKSVVTSQGTAQVGRGNARGTATITAQERPVKVSKRATNATSIPSKGRVAAPSTSRSGSAQSTASQKPATSSRSVVNTKDDRVVKRVKTEQGEKRVTEGTEPRDGEACALQHKKRAIVEEVKSEGPAKDDGWEDLDAEDADDPLMVAEYVNDIFEYMKELEMDYIPSGDYIEKHPDITWEMRGVLVDWLVDIHSKFRLLPETLFLAQNIVDRFLSLRTISLHKLQLVGLTAMFIAAKYEEVLCPSVQNFLYLAEGGYTDEEILKAERYMLKVLKFSFSYANPMNFLRRISKADNYDIQTRTVAKFFMEISLVDHRLLEHPPSLIAAAAVWNARLVLERGEWTPTLVHYSTYSVHELLQTAELMLDYCLRPVQHQAFIKKYSGKKFMKAAPYVMDWSKKTYGEFTPEQAATDELLLDLFGQYGYERIYSVGKSDRGSTAGPEDEFDDEGEDQEDVQYSSSRDQEEKPIKAATRDPLRERANQQY